jgi:hypothetical protein
VLRYAVLLPVDVPRSWKAYLPEACDRGRAKTRPAAPSGLAWRADGWPHGHAAGSCLRPAGPDLLPPRCRGLIAVRRNHLYIISQPKRYWR